MKPSPSTSPSSSSPSSYGRATSNCLSRILRRILNLPLCSFDRFKVDEGESSVATGPPDSTPGVVARLMGLDSVPSAEPVKESHSADRFKTSRGRDIPPYRELEDDKFFILSFERRQTGKTKTGSRRNRPVSEEKNGKREKRREKSKGKVAKRDFFAEAITSEYEGDSENSSPNSVLEFERFSAGQEFFSPGENSRLENSKTRRPLSEELESCDDPNPVDYGGEEVVKSEKKPPVYGGMAGEIGRLAAAEAMGTKWRDEELLKNRESLMEIGRDIASSIFDHLLEELVINLTWTTILSSSD